MIHDFLKFKTNNYPRLDICNDLFSRFEQQILFLEKQAEATDPTTDRRRVSFQNT